MLVKATAVGLVLTAIFTEYPAFLKRGGRVEAYTDRGPIVELIVRCGAGTGIVSFSKVEKLFCSSKNACFTALRPALDDTCG